MARITTEDCFAEITNRFELCLIVANRAKNILSGASTSFDRKEKPAVIALREVAEGVLNIEAQKNNIIKLIMNKGMSEISPSSQKIIDEVSEEIDNNLVETSSFKDTAFIDDNTQNDN
jgi:DNA-directed RNA polymerase subunit omega